MKHLVAHPSSPAIGGRRARFAAACLTVAVAASASGRPADADPRYRAGLGLLNRNLHAEAAVELQAFIDAGVDASSDPTELATARYSLALCHARMGRPVDAVKVLDRLQPPPGFAFAADALFLRGQCAAAAGDHVAVEVALDELMREHPDFGRLDRAAALRGESLLRAGRTAEAAAVLGGAARRWPEGSQRDRVDLLCATAEANLGDDAAAAQRLAALRGRGPAGSLALHATVLEAHCRRRLGQFAEALVLHDAALDAIGGASVAPRVDQVGRAELALGRAACLNELGRRPECLQACEACLVELTKPDAGDARPSPSEVDRLVKAAQLLMLHVRLEHGQALLAQGRGDEARTALESVAAAVGGAPGDEAPERLALGAAALRSLAAQAAREGRLDDAADLLGRIAATDGLAAADRAAALLDQGATLASAGRDHESEQVLTRFVEVFGADRRAPEAAQRRAMAVARQGRHDEALALFEAAEATAATRGRDGDATVDPALRWSAEFQHAAALVAAGRPAEAEPRLQRLLDASTVPALRARAAAELARLAVARGAPADLREAVDLLGRLAAARREAPSAGLDDLREPELFLLATSRFRLGDNDGAAETLAAFARECPESPRRSVATLMHADALIAGQRPAEAIAVLAPMLEASTECALAAPGLLRLGDACAQAQRWQGSQQAFERFLRLPPECPQATSLWHHARFGVGMALERQGLFGEAIEAYRDVASRHRGPTAARAQFQVGECLFAAGRHDEAVRELMKVDVLFAEPPWSAAALCEAGRCLVELGRTADARAQFDAVVERFPESPWAKVADERRAELRPASPAPLPGRGPAH